MPDYENEVLKELHDRRSVRAFTGAPIPPEARQAILEAAAQAPSAGCQQLYTILDIRNPDLKAALVKTCDNQPFIAQADLVLIFCADCRKWYQGFADCGCDPRKPGAGDLLLAVSDANIAAQNAVTAAWSLGIGSCYIGDIMENVEEIQTWGPCIETQKGLQPDPARAGETFKGFLAMLTSGIAPDHPALKECCLARQKNRNNFNH